MFNTPINKDARLQNEGDNTQLYEQPGNASFITEIPPIIDNNQAEMNQLGSNPANFRPQEPQFIPADEQKIRMVIKPDEFDGTPSKARVWFENYRFCCSVNEWSDYTACKRLPAYLTKSARNWFVSMIAGKPESVMFDRLEIAFYNEYVPRSYRNEIRMELNALKQQPGEAVTNFITDANKLCTDYDSKMSEIDRVDKIIDKLLPVFFPNIMEDDPQTVAELKAKAVKLEHGLKKRGSTAVASITKKEDYLLQLR